MLTTVVGEYSCKAGTAPIVVGEYGCKAGTAHGGGGPAPADTGVTTFALGKEDSPVDTGVTTFGCKDPPALAWVSEYGTRPPLDWWSWSAVALAG